MHRSTLSVIGVLAAAFPIQVAVAQQVSERIVGHVFKPERTPATEERVRSLKVRDGFRIDKFAEGLGKPRMIAVADDGWVYVTRRDEGDVVALRDTDGDGKADQRVTAISGMEHVHGIALRGEEVFLVTVKEVYSCSRNSDGTFGARKQLIDDLPDAGQHPNRTIAFGRDGKMYLTVGSTCNACNEPNVENATILRAEPDGSGRKVFASGLRNTIGFGWHPETGEMWGMDHGIDWLGDDVSREELNRLVEGSHYGWPIVFEDGKFNPADEPPKGESKEDYAAKCTSPVIMAQAHSAPLGMVFCSGEHFGSEYSGDGFVAMHGSWNRKPATGYEVVRVRFKDGEPKGFEPFVSGFLTDGGKKQFGRPCGLAFTKDALLVGDDDNGVIYRVWREKRTEEFGYPRGE